VKTTFADLHVNTIYYDVSETKIVGDYYLLGYEQALQSFNFGYGEFDNIFQSPRNKKIYKAKIIYSNLETVLLENTSSLFEKVPKNSIQISHLAIVTNIAKININDKCVRIKYIDKLVFARISIKKLSNGKYVNLSDGSEYDILTLITKYLKVCKAQLVNINNFTDKIVNGENFWTESEEFVKDPKILYQDICVRF